MLRATAVSFALCLSLILPNAALGGAGKLVAVERGAEIELRGSRGYRVQISAVGKSVEVLLRHGTAFAQYATDARVSPAGIDAGLGRYGRIAVDFRPSGKVERTEPLPGCRGKPAVTRHGVFVGAIRFRGEGGYTRVDVGRARGTFSSGGRWHCGFGAVEMPEGEDEEVTLEARCGSVVFGAQGGRSREQGAPVFPDERGFTGFFAAMTEDRGGIRIIRAALAFAAGGAFLYDEALTAATVRPHGPFHGSAEFLRDQAGEAHWAGTLVVSFPGRRWALAGPGFDARLARGGDLSSLSNAAPCSTAGK